MTKKLSNIFCTCIGKDIPVWKKTAGYLIQNIDAHAYHVIVPQNELTKFKRITPFEIEVIPENELIDFYTVKNVESALYHKWRSGWYFQQFLKIYSLLHGNDEDINLIWDADTIPLKKISFVDQHGRLTYYTGSEHHAPYFDQIKRSLGIEKKVQYSFIAQCFPAKSYWVKKYIAALEKHNECQWIEAILKNITQSETSGFSEYESMGTYFSHEFSEQMAITHGKWQRHGNKTIGISKFTNKDALLLSTEFDFISFESWDVHENLGVKKLKRLLGITS